MVIFGLTFLAGEEEINSRYGRPSYVKFQNVPENRVARAVGRTLEKGKKAVGLEKAFYWEYIEDRILPKWNLYSFTRAGLEAQGWTTLPGSATCQEGSVLSI